MILAAGEGTRLRPLTETKPKPMLEVNGKPVLEWILLWLKAHGIEEVAINLHYRPESVRECFGDGAGLGVRIHYSVEERILGTAGGVKRVQGLFEGPLVIAYGDVLTDLDLTRLLGIHNAKGGDPHVTLSLYHVANPWECGIVDIDAGGRVTRIVEKPPRHEIRSDLANAGVLVLDASLLDHVPAEGPYDIAGDLLPQLLRLGVDVYGVPLGETEYLIDIGTPEKFERAQREWPTPTARAGRKLQ
jgi:NDP-sugar pyrophosphorylase family protein